MCDAYARKGITVGNCLSARARGEWPIPQLTWCVQRHESLLRASALHLIYTCDARNALPGRFASKIRGDAVGHAVYPREHARRRETARIYCLTRPYQHLMARLFSCQRFPRRFFWCRRLEPPPGHCGSSHCCLGVVRTTSEGYGVGRAGSLSGSSQHVHARLHARLYPRLYARLYALKRASTCKEFSHNRLCLNSRTTFQKILGP
jgi:hypothetical protein